MSSLLRVFHCMLLVRVLSQRELLNMVKDYKEQKKFLYKETRWRSGKVRELTDDNFDRVIEKHENVLVAFTSPSCPGCASWLKSDFQRISDKLSDEQPPVFCGEVRAEVEKDLAQSLHIQIEEYPQLIFFKNRTDYRDIHPSKMSVKGVVRWVNEKMHTNPSLHFEGLPSLSSLNSVADFIKTRKNVVIGFFNDTYIPQSFLNVSKKGVPLLDHDKSFRAQTFVFAFTTTPQVAEFYNVEPPGLMLFMPGNEGSARYTGDMNNQSQIIHWVQIYKGKPVLDWRGLGTIKELNQAGRPAFFCIVGGKTDIMMSKYSVQNWMNVALRLNRRLISVKVSMKDWLIGLQDVEEIFHITLTKKNPKGALRDDEYPDDIIAIVENVEDRANRRIFKMPPWDEEVGYYTEEAIEAFARDYMQDNLPEFAKNDL